MDSRTLRRSLVAVARDWSASGDHPCAPVVEDLLDEAYLEMGCELDLDEGITPFQWDMTEEVRSCFWPDDIE